MADDRYTLAYKAFDEFVKQTSLSGTDLFVYYNGKVIENAALSDITSFVNSSLTATDVSFDDTTLSTGATNVQEVVEKTSRNDIVIVRAKSDLPTPSGGIIQLAADTEYNLNGIIALGTDRIVFNTNTSVSGSSASLDQFTYSGSSPMITGATGQRISLSGLRLTSTGSGALVAYAGAATAGVDLILVTRVVMIGPTGGAISGTNVIVWDQCQVITTGAGIAYSGTNNSIRYLDCGLQGLGSSGILLDLDAGTFNDIRIDRCGFIVPSGMTGIDASTATITTSAIISESNASGAGTATVNISCDTPEWRLSDNTGNFDNTFPSGGYNMESNATTTTISTVGEGNWVKVAGTTIEAAGSCQFEQTANNEVTYRGIQTFRGIAISSLNIARSSGSGGLDFEMTIFKNGTKLANIRKAVEIDQKAKSVTVLSFVELATDDVLDVRIQQLSGGAHAPLISNMQTAV